jgi:UDP-N-acetylmuramoyl-tripeptide--D-alanyl-D-alanine ligase
MIPITIERIIEVVDGRLVCGSADGAAVGVGIDSRTVRAGDVFFAIRGAQFDGHDYAAAALEKGAACVVVERVTDVPVGCSGAVVVVADSIAALGKLAAWYRRQIPAKVIAITGSAGKTTTRQVLCQALSPFYRCRQAPKSFNNNIGMPLTILSAEREDEILLLELGSNHPGEIAELTRLAQPDAAVVTFIGPAHLEGFGTLGNVLAEKISIAQGLRPGGTLYLNGDQPELVEKGRTLFGGRIITFGSCPECDIIGTDLRLSGNTGSLVIDGVSIDVPLAGRANLMNVLTVWSVCRDLNVSLSDFAEVISRLKPVSMRLEVLPAGSLTILNDCYNANPASMANALDCLGGFAGKQKRLVFIAGTMYELGDQSQVLHRELGRQAAAQGVGLLLCVGPFAEAIAAGARAARGDIQALTFENTDKLCNILHKSLQPDDIVLVKGSRAAGLEKAVEAIVNCKL